MDKRTFEFRKKVIGYLAKKLAKRDANTACSFLGYQAKLPMAVKKLKKK